MNQRLCVVGIVALLYGCSASSGNPVLAGSGSGDGGSTHDAGGQTSSSAQGYLPETTTQDYTAICSQGTLAIWRSFDWQAQIPTGTSIVIAAQSGVDASSLLPITPVLLATATTSTDVGTGGSYDVALIDTGANGTGAFNTVTPPVFSRNLLRVYITLNPNPDITQRPTLIQYLVKYDCVPAT
jgi:hypothetical protein